MSLQDQIAADEQALAAAQAQLDEDRAKLAAIKPHLSLLSRIEEHVAGAEESVKSGVLSLVAEMRDLLNR